MPLCHFQRANRSKRFSDVEEAKFGHCASKKETYFGFEGHVVMSGSGFITGYTVTKPNVEREASFECVTGISGLLLGDKGYSGENYHWEMIGEKIQVSVPPKKNQKDEETPLFRRYLNKTRRRVETVIGQLTERFSISKIWARDTWHLTNRIARKILSHTIAMLLLRENGDNSMAIDEILTS